MKKDQIINQLNFLRHMANGAEYWLAREMQSILGYSEWRNFENAIERAKASCVSSGKRIENHFVDVTKMVPVGSDSKRQIEDLPIEPHIKNIRNAVAKYDHNFKILYSPNEP
ncbi:MAG: hypothetical protein AB2610_08130 [Candidatus Thiodiazotropha sp.]